jgi:hypothetical protein
LNQLLRRHNFSRCRTQPRQGVRNAFAFLNSGYVPFWLQQQGYPRREDFLCYGDPPLIMHAALSAARGARDLTTTETGAAIPEQFCTLHTEVDFPVVAPRKRPLEARQTTTRQPSKKSSGVFGPFSDAVTEEPQEP